LSVAGHFQLFHACSCFYQVNRALVGAGRHISQNIIVSFFDQSVHGGAMHGDAIEKAMTYSFWGLGLMISAGIVLAVLIW
jgi:hypothetical protein